MDLNGKEISRFQSSEEAALKYGFTRTGINQCIRGKTKTYKGFLWKREGFVRVGSKKT